MKKNCATSWFYVQDYTRIHGEQNIKFCVEHANRAVQGVGLKPLFSRDCGFETCWWHDADLLHLLCVVQLLAPATSSSLAQGSPTVRVCLCLIVCVLETLEIGRPRPDLTCSPTKKVCNCCHVMHCVDHRMHLIKYNKIQSMTCHNCILRFVFHCILLGAVFDIVHVKIRKMWH